MLLATLLKVELAFLPRVVMAAMQTTTIRASITAYSTAVGPSSRLTNWTAWRLSLRSMVTSKFGGEDNRLRPGRVPGPDAGRADCPAVAWDECPGGGTKEGESWSGSACRANHSRHNPRSRDQTCQIACAEIPLFCATLARAFFQAFPRCRVRLSALKKAVSQTARSFYAGLMKRRRMSRPLEMSATRSPPVVRSATIEPR